MAFWALGLLSEYCGGSRTRQLGMTNLGLGEGPGPMWRQGGRCSPSTLSHLIIHRALQTEGEACFFLASTLPSSVSTGSICCHLCCSSPLLPLRGSHLAGFLGLHYCGSMCLEISKPEGLTSLRVALEASGEMFSAVPELAVMGTLAPLGTAPSERVEWSPPGV